MPLRRSCSLVVGGSLLLFSAAAWGQSNGPSPEEIAARRTLLEQAQSAADGGDHAGAARLAEQAVRIQSTPSVRFFLAREQRALGHFSAAAGNAEFCVHDAEHNPSVTNREALLEGCRGLLREVRASGGLLQLAIPSRITGNVRVVVAGEPVASSLLGVPMLVQPGELLVEATVPGQSPWSQRVQVHRGETVSIELFSEQSAEPRRAPPPSDQPLTPPRSPLSSAGPFVLGVGGGVGVALGVTFLVLSELAVEGCGPSSTNPATMMPGTPCPFPNAAERVNNSNTFAGVAAGGFVLAGAAVGTGVALLVLGARPPRESQEETALVPVWSPGGVGLRGRF